MKGTLGWTVFETIIFVHFNLYAASCSKSQKFTSLIPEELSVTPSDLRKYIPTKLILKGTKDNSFQPNKKEENSHWQYRFMEISNLITNFKI